MLINSSKDKDLDLNKISFERDTTRIFAMTEPSQPAPTDELAVWAGKIVRLLPVEKLPYIKDINKTIPNTRLTLLHLAAGCNNLPAVKALLNAGANIEATDGVRTPIDYADTFQHREIVQYLTERGSKPVGTMRNNLFENLLSFEQSNRKKPTYIENLFDMNMGSSMQESAATNPYSARDANIVRGIGRNPTPKDIGKTFVRTAPTGNDDYSYMPNSLTSEGIEMASMTLIEVRNNKMLFRRDYMSFMKNNPSEIEAIYFDDNWVLAEEYIALVSEAKQNPKQQQASDIFKRLLDIPLKSFEQSNRKKPIYIENPFDMNMGSSMQESAAANPYSATTEANFVRTISRAIGRNPTSEDIGKAFVRTAPTSNDDYSAIPDALTPKDVEIASMTLLEISKNEMRFRQNNLPFVSEKNKEATFGYQYFDENWVLAEEYIALVNEAKQNPRKALNSRVRKRLHDMPRGEYSKLRNKMSNPLLKARESNIVRGIGRNPTLEDIGKAFVRTAPNSKGNYSYMPDSLTPQSVKTTAVTLITIDESGMLFYCNDDEIKDYSKDFDGNWVLADDYIALVSQAKQKPSQPAKPQPMPEETDSLTQMLNELLASLTPPKPKPTPEETERLIQKMRAFQLDHENSKSSSHTSSASVQADQINYLAQSPYAIFGLPEEECSLANINNRYRSLSLQHHPDKGGDPEIFKKIGEAYGKLLERCADIPLSLLEVKESEDFYSAVSSYFKDIQSYDTHSSRWKQLLIHLEHLETLCIDKAGDEKIAHILKEIHDTKNYYSIAEKLASIKKPLDNSDEITLEAVTEIEKLIASEDLDGFSNKWTLKSSGYKRALHHAFAALLDGLQHLCIKASKSADAEGVNNLWKKLNAANAKHYALNSKVSNANASHNPPQPQPAKDTQTNNESSTNVKDTASSTETQQPESVQGLEVGFLRVGDTQESSNIPGQIKAHISTINQIKAFIRFASPKEPIPVPPTPVIPKDFQKSNGSFTPIHAAVLKGDKAEFESLLEQGANVYAKDETGKTALGYSATLQPAFLATAACPRHPTAAVAQVLKPFLNQWYRTLAKGPCTYEAHTQDFGVEIKNLLISSSIQEGSIRASEGHFAWNDHVADMIHIATRLGFSLTLTKEVYSARDHWLRLPNNTVKLQYIPNDEKIMEIALERAFSKAAYFDESALTLCNNRYFKNNLGVTHMQAVLVHAEAKTLFRDAQRLQAAHLEGGNMFIVNNSKGEKRALIGRDHFAITQNIHRQDKRLFPQFVSAEGNFKERLAKELSAKKIRHTAEVMYSQGILKQDGYSGLLNHADLEQLFGTAVKQRTSIAFKERAVQHKKIQPFAWQDSAAEDYREITANYLFQKHLTRSFMANELGLQAEQLQPITQLGYHLDTFLKPGPHHSFFVSDFKMGVELCELLLSKSAQLDLSDKDKAQLVAYASEMQKLAIEAEPLLQKISKELPKAGLQIIPVPGRIMDDPKKTDADCNNVNFMNALSGWSSKTQRYYYITSGAKSADRVGDLLMDAFTCVLSQYVPDIEVYFIGRDPNSPSIFTEAQRCWGSYLSQSGIHCMSFELDTESHTDTSTL